MHTEHEQLVIAFCDVLLNPDLDRLLSFLHLDVTYQNMPWQPYHGHEGVRKALTPFIESDTVAMTKMEIHHTIASGNTVMNERSETWTTGEEQVVLSVAGVFEIQDGKIIHWRDYFDGAAMEPLLAAVE